MKSWDALLPYLLPQEMLNYFDLVTITEQTKGKDTELVLSIEEKSEIPKEFEDRHLHSHGFCREVKMYHYPINGRTIRFQVKRRRWLDADTQEVVKRDWEMVARGTQLSVEFASFLKGLHRLSRD